MATSEGREGYVKRSPEEGGFAAFSSTYDGPKTPRYYQERSNGR